MANDPDAPLRGMEAVLHAIFEPQLDSMMNDFGEAHCYAVVTFDPTTGYANHIGPIATLDEAYAYRKWVVEELDKAVMEGDVPFQATVVPMLPPSWPEAGSAGTEPTGG